MKTEHLTSPRNTITLAALAFALAFSSCTLGLSGCKSATPDDASLNSSVQAKIAADGALGNEPIQSSVQNGVATLSGNVSSEAVRALAARDAAQVAGLKTVVNNLTVQSAPAPATAQVTTPPEIPVHPVKPSAEIEKPKISAHKLPSPPAIHDQPQEANREPDREPGRDVHQDSAQQAQAPAPIERAAPPAPAIRDITVPSGTTLPVRITQTLDSASTQQGENFTGTIAADVFIDGLNVLPRGTPVSGRVDAVQDAGHFKGNSLLTIEVTSIHRGNQHIPVATEAYSKEGTGRGKNTAEKVGGGAAIGAILGGIFGGGKGAAIGGLAGGGVGAGAQAATRGQQVQIPAETLVRFRTSSPISVRTDVNSNNNAPAPDNNLQRHPINEPPR